MNENLVDRCVAIVGLGLMGGSYAKALKRRGVKRILAFDADQRTLENGLADGCVDEIYTTGGTVLRDAALIIFCTPAAAMCRFIKANAAHFSPHVVITDIAGIKGNLAVAVKPYLGDGMDFVAGHPMAGCEGQGYGRSRADIFDGANYILIPTPDNKGENIDAIAAMAKDLGCARVACVTAAEHDRLIAYTSNLPHVLATALINCEAMDEATKYFIAGSFRDGTRVANINAPLWRDLLLSNRENVLHEITAFQQTLGHFAKLLEAKDGARLKAFLEEASRRRRDLLHE
ncbi:prephenate dehydrogenase [Megasphaera vaginalis (ex Bordigoni et al. 2020)]|uniref:prephenate dehydrogenase n=1 Tax=Megasphaera vaginalis (ex Bordigoni et al. 2020) TaxID=2045301 RepID=UPI000C7A16E2|nr:prephenate dehydrogenase [Megasphaera vaginalis (ex Bordigoni et al. 2020)]